MAKYERLEEAPCQQFSFVASSLFKNLQPESKDIVWRRFHAWVKVARRKENWHSMGLPDFDGLNEAEEDTLAAMAEGARNGFCSLWETAERNAHNRNGKGDDGSTVVDGGQTNSRPKEETNKNELKKPTNYRKGRVVAAANYEQRDYSLIDSKIDEEMNKSLYSVGEDN